MKTPAAPVAFALLLTLSLVAPVPAVTVEEADALYKADKWEEASAAYTELIATASGPAKARMLGARGYALERLNRFDESMASYRAAIDEPGATGLTRSYAQSRLGYLTIQPGKDYDLAVKLLLGVADIPEAHPNYIAESLLFASTAAVKADRPDQALEILQRMEAVVAQQGASPHYLGDARMRMGRIYQDRKDYKSALEVYRLVLTMTGSTGRQKAWAQGFVDDLELLAQGDMPFYIQPYVTNVGHDRAEIFWISQGQNPPGSVILTGGDGQTFTIQATAEPIRDTYCHLHKAEATGLSPGVLYRYEATCGGQSRPGRFRANPLPGSDVEVVIGVTGDTQAAPDIHLGVAKQIARDEPDLTLHVGDLTDLGSAWSKWRAELFEPAVPYNSLGAFWPAVGNHDGGPYFGILFNRPPRRLWTSFDYGPVHVAIVDSYWFGSSRRGGRDEQLQWLRDSLQNTRAAWKLVVLHVPMIATVTDVEWWGFDDFLPAMEELGVDLVLSGHHPMYRKYLPIARTGLKPIYHVTTGGGGPTGPPAPSPLLEAGSALPHATIIRVKGDRLELEARLIDGSRIDHFVLTKTDGRYQDEVMARAVDRDLAWQLHNLYYEILQTQSNQLVLGLEGTLSPGQPVTFTFDATTLPRGPLKRHNLPAGATLLLKPAPGCAWTGPEVRLPLEKDKHSFTFTAPEKLSVGGGSFRPPLVLEMNVEVSGRRFQPFQVAVRLSAESAGKAAAVIGGLPAVWEFKLDPDDRGQNERWFAHDSPSGPWEQAPVTDWWEHVIGKDYDGIAWYRVAAAVAPLEPGHRLWLEFGAVDESLWLYVNSRLVASQVYDSKRDAAAWEKPRRFDVTDYVRPGASDNLFAVRVQDLFGMGGLYRGAVLKSEPANRLPHGSMDDGLANWRVTAGDADAVAIGHGRYVGEQALLVDVREPGAIRLSRTFSADLTTGSQEFYARLSARPAGGGVMDAPPLTIEAFLGDGQNGHPAATLVLPASVSGAGDEWITLAAPLHAQRTGEQPLTIHATFRQPGLYALDELGVLPPP